MGQITRFAVRSNGRVLADVRRPAASKPTVTKVSPPKVEPAAPMSESRSVVDPDEMTKAELVEMAEARGLDASGTKADIADRLNG